MAIDPTRLADDFHRAAGRSARAPLLADGGELSRLRAVAPAGCRFWLRPLVARTNPMAALRVAAEVVGPQAALRHARYLARVERVPLPERGLAALVADGVLPPDALELGTAVRPGVVGLAVRPSGGGVVCPLVATPTASWSCSPTLPFTVGEVLDSIARLMSERDGVAGLRPMALSSPLGVASDGESMTLAAALAVAATNAPEWEAVAVLGRCLPDGGVVPVGGVRAKLTAFLREYGWGSLLVAATPPPADLAERFDQVWLVRTAGELAARLASIGALDRLLTRGPLTPFEVAVARLRMAAPAALGADSDFAHRLFATPFAADVPFTLRSALLRDLADAHRGRGRWAEAVRVSDERCRLVDTLGSDAGIDHQAGAQTDRAAVLLQSFHFPRAVSGLTPWVGRVDGVAGPDVRVSVYNTLGRALAASGGTGWEELFGRSLDLQAKTDPGSTARTRTYLIRELLRAGALDRAEAELTAHPPADPLTAAHRVVLWAELDRLRGRVSNPDTPAVPIGFDHLRGFFLQCVGRQTARPSVERVALLTAAADAFGDTTGLLRLFAALARLAAAAPGSTTSWATAVSELRRVLAAERSAGLSDYFDTGVSALGDTPDPPAAEALFAANPFF